MKKSSVFHVNCTLLATIVAVLLISMPVFCYGDLRDKNDSVLIVEDENDTIPISDLGMQIDMLAYKLEDLENSLRGVLQSVTKTNDYIKAELVDTESEDSGIIKNVVSMIVSERQEVENALKQQAEIKALLKLYGSVLKKKTAVHEKKADSPAQPAAAAITETKTVAALSENEPAPQKAETPVITNENTLLSRDKKEEPKTVLKEKTAVHEKKADSPAQPAAAVITETKTEAALSKNETTTQKTETHGITITHMAIGLILIFVVVLLIVTLTMFQKISGNMNDSEGLQADTMIPLQTAGDTKSGTNGNVDHSLPIVVGEAIFRIRMTMNGVDRSNEEYSVFGYQLSRVEDAIMRHGYSIIDLTGKPYENDQSMKVVNIVERDDIDPGETIVNRMLKPRIMFDKTIVSHGTVELATSSKVKKIEVEKPLAN